MFDKTNRFLFFVFLLFVLLTPFIHDYINSKSTLWAWLSVGALGLIFTSLEQFANFRIGPIRAEMRKVKDELEHVKKLAVTFAKPVLGLTIGAGRWGGLGPIGEILQKDLIKKLDKMDLLDNQFEEALSIYKLYVLFDYRGMIIEAIPNTLAINKPDDIKLLRGKVKDPKKLEDIQEIIKNLNCSTPQILELLEDYKYCFESKHCEIRRPGLFEKRHH